MDLDALQQGIYAARQGRRAEARAWLREALRRDPNNEQAWLWLSTVVETDAEYQMCLERALAINPLNETTRARLRDALRGSRREITHHHPTEPLRSETISPSIKPLVSAPVPTVTEPDKLPARSSQGVRPVPARQSRQLAMATPQASASPDKLVLEPSAEQPAPAIPIPALAVIGCLTVTAISGLLVLISLVLMGWAS